MELKILLSWANWTGIIFTRELTSLSVIVGQGREFYLSDYLVQHQSTYGIYQIMRHIKPVWIFVINDPMEAAALSI